MLYVTLCSILVLLLILHNELLDDLLCLQIMIMLMCKICQGHAYNTFPKMGDTWIPEDVFDMKPLIRNFFENTSTVQVFILS
jgi:hypothetical protein